MVVAEVILFNPPLHPMIFLKHLKPRFLFRAASISQTGRRFHNSNSYAGASMASISPYIIENQGRQPQITDVFSRCLQERIVYLMEPVTDDLASTVIAQLLYLNSESTKKPIYVYINSPGGSVSAGLGIYDTMQYIQAPVSTICIGQACSMGSLLLMAGEKGMRYSLPYSRIMVHQPSISSIGGPASDVSRLSEYMVRMRSNLNNIYHRHTDQSIENIEKAMDRDTFMEPQEALLFGLIDKVLTKKMLEEEQATV